MSIFKKSIKHSKSSHLSEQIEMLDKELNKTGVTITESDKILASNQKETVEEDLKKINWRKDLLEEETNSVEEEINLIKEDVRVKNNSLKRVDNHIKNIDGDFARLRQEIFEEISENFLFNIPNIENKIDRVLAIYNNVQEGLLNQPPSTKNSDPLTPLDRNFVTIDELNNHYKLFINRIQEQVATIGGGGEYRFQYLDGIVGIQTNSAVYNGKYLQWNSATNKAEFVAVSSGNSGIATYASISGIATYASTAGISTNVIGGIASVTSLSVSGITTLGIVTAVTSINFSNGGLLGDPYGDGGFGLKSAPNQYATIASNNLQQYIQVDNTTTYIGTGYGSTTGSYDWQFKKDGSTQFPNGLILAPPGQSITLQSDQYSQLMWMNADQTVGPDKFTNVDFFVASGYAILDIGYRDGASNQQYKSWGWSLNGLQFPDLTIQDTAFTGYAPTAGIATVAQGLTGSPNITVGIVTASSFSGSGINLTGIVTSIVAGTNVTVSGSTGQVTINATGGGGTNYWSQTAAGINTLSNVGIGTTNPTSKLQVNGTIKVTNGDVEIPNGYAVVINGQNAITVSSLGPTITSSSLTTVGTLQHLGVSGNVNVTGITTTARLSVGTGGTVITTTSGGLVGIGTTNPTSKLTVQGDVLVSGIVTASSFSGSGINLTGIVTSIVAGTNVTVSGSTGQVTINATGVGSGSNYWSQTAAGINTLSNVGIGTTNPTSKLTVGGSFTATDTRIQSVAEKTTLVNGNTVSLVYNTGGGNVAICTNPSGNITLNVTGIPTDSAFDNYSLAFSVIVTNTGTARSCTAITLNGVSETILWFGGSLSAAISGVTTTNGYDVYSFTGINTVGSASTTANYIVLGSVNGSYR